MFCIINFLENSALEEWRKFVLSYRKFSDGCFGISSHVVTWIRQNKTGQTSKKWVEWECEKCRTRKLNSSHHLRLPLSSQIFILSAFLAYITKPFPLLSSDWIVINKSIISSWNSHETFFTLIALHITIISVTSRGSQSKYIFHETAKESRVSVSAKLSLES